MKFAATITRSLQAGMQAELLNIERAPLSLSAARGCALAVPPELLRAAEAGLVEALCADAGPPIEV
jgi:hypothetical protein